MKGEDEASGGIQSLDAALRLLSALSDRGEAASLSDLARDCGMPPSKVHRYLASFQHAGLVTQAGRSGKYDLGPGALRLGLSALARHDFVNTTADAMPELVAKTGLTALLSVWGTQGATVVRWERAAVPTVTSMGLGTVMPLLHSATGRAFLGWAPAAVLDSVLSAELAMATGDLPRDRAGAEALVKPMREAGYTWVEGRFIPGLVAVAAPILDWQGQAQAVVTLIGTDPSVTDPQGGAVTALKAFAAGLSFG